MAIGVLLVGGVLAVGETAYGNRQSVSTEKLIHPRFMAIEETGGIMFFHVATEDALETGIHLARAWQPDIIHLHTAWLWPVACALRAEIATPLVFTVHSLDRAEYELGGFVNRWEVQETVIAEADRLIALSHSEHDLLLQYYPDTRERVRVLGNGVADYAAAQAVTQRGKRNGSPLVLYTGRFVDRKGIRELLTAIPMVLKQAQSTHFVLVGGYGGGAEIEREWLVDALRPYSSQVLFTGWLAPQEVEAWYRRADILVVPSWYEPFGMVILEGMLHGLPIAASNVGGPAEILEHGRTALLFPPKNATALAQTLVRLATNPGLRHRIGATAAKEVRQKWLWPHIVEKMQAIYEETIIV